MMFYYTDHRWGFKGWKSSETKLTDAQLYCGACDDTDEYIGEYANDDKFFHYNRKYMFCGLYGKTLYKRNYVGINNEWTKEFGKTYITIGEMFSVVKIYADLTMSNKHRRQFAREVKWLAKMKKRCK